MSGRIRRILTIWLALTLVLFAGLAVTACDGDTEDAVTEPGVEVDDADADDGADADDAADGAEDDEAADDSTADDGADDSAGIDAAMVVDTKCTSCHDLERVEQADYDVAGWESTIERMESLGLSITEEEKQAVAEYLATR